MDPKLKLLFSVFHYFFLLPLLSGGQGVVGSSEQHRELHTGHHLFDWKPTKLFVFGDSYADTGNIGKPVSSSWKQPYGVTFPGKPAGRFSDGRVFTDYLAKFVGVKSPIPYRWRKLGFKHLKSGMNFAYGGTGVFETLSPEPNMTTQIDFFQCLIKDGVYKPRDLHNSLALVTLSGNDYSAYIARNGSAQGWRPFITRVVNQLTLNLKRIHGIGVRKVAVSALQPLGCLPQSTIASSFQQCNQTQNSLVAFHNLLLQQAVGKLNNQTNDSAFVILDLFGAFMTVLKNKGVHPGSWKFEDPLKPCCVGISSEYSCGSVDEISGEKKYTVCANPESFFFWDTVHPTQEGWLAVYAALQTNLQQI